MVDREWTHVESFSSKYGLVEKLPSGEWLGRVNVGGRFARLSETFESAQVAMGSVMRTWDREQKKMGKVVNQPGMVIHRSEIEEG